MSQFRGKTLGLRRRLATQARFGLRRAVETDRCIRVATETGRISTGLRVGGLNGVLSLALALLTAGCGATTPAAETPTTAPDVTRRDTTIVHEPCAIDGSNASSQDVNRDGKPDLVTVRESGKLTCRWLDLNVDGVVDVWVYYDANGQVRRRETDYDRDGRIDEIEVRQAGQIVSRERAATLAGKLDTWQFFEGGVLVRGERDANGDGIVDQWWEYSDAAHPECGVVHSDTDGDGRPDPGATVDVCGEGSPLNKNTRTNDDSSALPDAPLTETVEDSPAAPKSSSSDGDATE